jgi:hypothetical protein
MKSITQLFIAVFLTSTVFAQDFTGQWKGQFTDNSTSYMSFGSQRCDYVLELECKGTAVTGFSYTYFNEGGKRYFTICRLEGKLNKSSKYVEVKEVERTKTNVPNNIRNCFQIHKLTFYKKGDEQTLEGSWIPAPDQEGDCGYGSTMLSRRLLKRNTPLYNNNNATAKRLKPAFKPDTKTTAFFKDKNKNTTPPPVAKKTTPVTPPVVRINPETNTVIKPETTVVTKPNPVQRTTPDISFEKRNNTLLKTIEIENSTFKVDLYDNGEIDGDTISLFFNGKLLLSHKRLSDKSITLNLNVENDEVNELIMYADNLGSIPPNTALMVVTDGEKRYEVRISSDLQKSGVIRFVHKPKTTQ